MTPARDAGGAATEAELAQAYAVADWFNDRYGFCSPRMGADIALQMLRVAALAQRAARSGEAVAELEDWRSGRLRTRGDANRIDHLNRALAVEIEAREIAERRERDAIAMILFVGLCAGERIGRLQGAAADKEWVYNEQADRLAIAEADVERLEEELSLARTANRAVVSDLRLGRLCTSHYPESAVGQQLAETHRDLDALRDRLAASERALAGARAALRQVEKRGRSRGGHTICPSCGGLMDRGEFGFPTPPIGHAPGCVLAAELAAELAPDPTQRPDAPGQRPAPAADTGGGDEA